MKLLELNYSPETYALIRREKAVEMLPLSIMLLKKLLYRIICFILQKSMTTLKRCLTDYIWNYRLLLYYLQELEYKILVNGNVPT
jgi:hypothetical protein